MDVLLFSQATALVAVCLLSARALYRLPTRSFSTQDPVVLLHVMFSGLPLALDLIVGQPTYRHFRGLSLSSADTTANIIYCIYISLAPFLINLLAGRPLTSSNKQQLGDPAAFCSSACLWCLIVLPLPVLLCSPDAPAYLEFGAIAKKTLTDETSSYHGYIAAAAMLCVTASAGVLLRTKRFTSAAAGCIPFIVLSGWIVGKRYLFAFIVLLGVLVLIQRGKIKGWLGFVTITATVGLLAVGSIWYQVAVRNVAKSSNDRAYLYDIFRLDLGRDHTIRHAIYCELDASYPKILENRAHSFSFYPFIFVPRRFWHEKPLPYAQYVTSAAIDAGPRLWGWGLTTSWLDEAIANFGWLGMLIGPGWIGLICRLGNQTRDSFLRIFAVLIAALFLAVELTAFIVLFLLWTALMIASILPQRSEPATVYTVQRPRFPKAY